MHVRMKQWPSKIVRPFNSMAEKGGIWVFTLQVDLPVHG
jgi:hypothetical protein